MKNFRIAFILVLLVILFGTFMLTGCSTISQTDAVITTDTLNTFLQALVSLVLIPAVIALGKVAFDYIKSKTHNAALDKYLDMANDAVVTAVAETMQTFVTTMKQSGQWNEEAAKRAFIMAKLKAQELMSAAALQALPEIVGDVEKWLTAKVEAATLAQKNLMPIMLEACAGSTEAT